MLDDGVVDERRQRALESAPAPLEEELVGREVVARDLEALGRERGEEAERVPSREALDEPDKVRVAPRDRGALLWVEDLLSMRT